MQRICCFEFLPCFLTFYYESRLWFYSMVPSNYRRDPHYNMRQEETARNRVIEHTNKKTAGK
jgi:hypothetical protein